MWYNNLFFTFSEGIVERVILLGAPIPLKDEDWEDARKVHGLRSLIIFKFLVELEVILELLIFTPHFRVIFISKRIMALAARLDLDISFFIAM